MPLSGRAALGSSLGAGLGMELDAVTQPVAQLLEAVHRTVRWRLGSSVGERLAPLSPEEEQGTLSSCQAASDPLWRGLLGGAQGLVELARTHLLCPAR